LLGQVTNLLSVVVDKLLFIQVQVDLRVLSWLETLEMVVSFMVEAHRVLEMLPT
jgi:hypothetical protein